MKLINKIEIGSENSYLKYWEKEAKRKKEDLGRRGSRGSNRESKRKKRTGRK